MCQRMWLGYLVFLVFLAPLRAEEIVPSSPAPFVFTKVDLELLRQTDAFDRDIEERGWVYEDPALNAYLEKLGLSLCPAQTPENVKWRFRAVRDLEVNAFALPNGSIYVNSGLLARMENEAQLAGTLGHEITHVLNRHAYLSYRSARKKAVAVDVILAATRGADYAGAGPLVVYAMGNLLPAIVVSTIYGYSRDLEHEADENAVEMLNAHGYDLHEFARSFTLIQDGPEVELNREPVFWSSHPKLASRVIFVDRQASSLQKDARGLAVNQAAYREATVDVVRHDAALALLLGRPRTAVAIAQRLIADDPSNADNYVLLGDAYRGLGARTSPPRKGRRNY